MTTSKAFLLLCSKIVTFQIVALFDSFKNQLSLDLRANNNAPYTEIVYNNAKSIIRNILLYINGPDLSDMGFGPIPEFIPQRVDDLAEDRAYLRENYTKLNTVNPWFSKMLLIEF